MRWAYAHKLFRARAGCYNEQGFDYMVYDGSTLYGTPREHEMLHSHDIMQLPMSPSHWKFTSDVLSLSTLKQAIVSNVMYTEVQHTFGSLHDAHVEIECVQMADRASKGHLPHALHSPHQTPFALEFEDLTSLFSNRDVFLQALSLHTASVMEVIIGHDSVPPRKLTWSASKDKIRWNVVAEVTPDNTNPRVLIYPDTYADEQFQYHRLTVFKPSLVQIGKLKIISVRIFRRVDGMGSAANENMLHVYPLVSSSKQLHLQRRQVQKHDQSLFHQQIFDVHVTLFDVVHSGEAYINAEASTSCITIPLLMPILYL